LQGASLEVKGERLDAKGKEDSIADNQSSTPYTLHPTPTDAYRLIASSPHNLPVLEEEQYAFKRNVQRVWWVGNVMIDTLLANRARFRRPAIYDELSLQEKNYVVMTMHRPANVDEEQHLKALMEQIITNVHNLPIIFPIHPRTAKLFYNLWGNEEQLRSIFPNLHIVDPMGYLEFNYLVEHAKVVVTDSGGITEETTVMGVPCITLRDNTERPETCTIGTNRLIGTNPNAIKPALDILFAGQWQQGAIPPLWDGHTAERIVEILYAVFSERYATV
jgi:UDP-N-acetylglucosamine 2-epimerase (non-hydrolysing)